LSDSLPSDPFLFHGFGLAHHIEGLQESFFSRGTHTTPCWATHELPRLECIDEVLRVDVVGKMSGLEEKLARKL
jgi:hypothetical protein